MAAAATAASSSAAALKGFAAEKEVFEQRLDFGKLVRFLALLSNLLLQLSPIRMVREMQQAGSTLQYDALPVVTLFFGSVQWFLYGVFGFVVAGDAAMVDLMEAYVMGVALGLIYLATFVRQCRDAAVSAQLWSQITAGVCIVAFEVLCAVVLPFKLALRILGSLCAVFSIIVTASPLVSIEDVFRTRSVSMMQTDMVIVCFCGSCAWAALGFMMHDVNIALPNCFGIAIGGIQVHLIMKYSDTGPWFAGAANSKETGSSALLRGLREERSELTRPLGLGENYEASLYMRTKVFTLVAFAHCRLVVQSYFHFATDTLSEVWAWLTEIEPCRQRQKRCCSCLPSSCTRSYDHAGTELGEHSELL